MRPDAEHEPDADHVDEQRRAAVTDERQRDAGDRHQADHHADVLEDLKHEHRHDPDDDICTSQIGALERDHDQAVDEQKIQEQEQRGPLEAELLADHDENRIRVRIRDEPPVLRVALHVTVPGKTARTDRRQRFLRLVFRVVRRRLRIDVRVDALVPVVFAFLGQEIPDLFIVRVEHGDEQEQSADHQGDAGEHMPIFDPADPEHAKQDDDVNDRVAQIRLDHDERKRQQRNRGDRQQVGLERERIAVPAGEDARHRHDQQNLHELGRLKQQIARQFEPAPRAVDFNAHKIDKHQQRNADAVQYIPKSQEKPVVEQHRADRHGEAGQVEDELLQVIIGIHRVAISRAPHDYHADDHEQPQYEHDAKVDSLQLSKHTAFIPFRRTCGIAASSRSCRRSA